MSIEQLHDKLLLLTLKEQLLKRIPYKSKKQIIDNFIEDIAFNRTVLLFEVHRTYYKLNIAFEVIDKTLKFKCRLALVEMEQQWEYSHLIDKMTLENETAQQEFINHCALMLSACAHRSKTALQATLNAVRGLEVRTSTVYKGK